MNSNCSLLVLLVIILIIIIVSPKSNRKNKSNKDFHQQLETFVSQLESGNTNNINVNNKKSNVAIV